MKKFIVSPFTNSVAEGALSRGTLATLSAEYGDVPMARVLSTFLRAYAEAHGLPRAEWPEDAVATVDDPRPTLRSFIADCLAERRFKPDTGYTGRDAWNSGKGRLRAAYGVANVRTMPGLERLRMPIFALWAHVFNFVWVGWSAGGLHYDDMDNVLTQVCGTKEIVIFPPEATDLIDGGHYPTKFESRAFFSAAAFAASPHLAAVPHHRVKLQPGMAVAIPSRAYHAPLATSHDSVSINSFLAPSLLYWSFPSAATGNFFTRDGVGRYFGSWLGYYVKWFGWLPSAVQYGNYDYY